MFKQYHIIFLALIGPIYMLGTRQVTKRQVPLQDLGARISAQVEENLAPLRSRNFPHFHNLDNLGEQITSSVNEGLAPLQNLGQNIQQQVEQSLQPVKAMQITFQMKDGVGGTTIATHLPGGKRFVIQNYRTYACSGPISPENGKCEGNLTPFEIETKQDYCFFRNSYSIINEWLCLGGSSISVINNQIDCRSNSGRPALLIKVEEFRELCKGISDSVEYKYIANLQDPAHVEIPNPNKYVKCVNNQHGVCVFTETNSLPSYSSGGSFIINNNNYHSNSNIVYK